MGIGTLAAEVAVWMVGGVPARLVWNGVRYRVSDAPTPISEETWAPQITHAARRVVGWRFQGTTPSGVSLMFEIVEAECPTGWRLTRVYE